ncbi:MAG: VIT domain-containing protein [Planctomycetaceae bacterium]
MKTEVPAEAEARMRAHLDALRSKMGVPLLDGREGAPSTSKVDHRGRQAVPPVRRRPLAPLAAVALAAAAVVVWMTAALVGPGAATRAFASQEFVLVPEGGRLDALDAQGRLVGPCPLKHTDVDVAISGHFTRVKVAQRYRNPYKHKIEAVYTFPLSHRAAVDRMTMTVGDRVVQGEVKERMQARQIYEAARSQGHVAALLEQERPNIFTQSVANIEAGAEVLVEISYVEVAQSIDGEYRFDFPMVVAPRYIPGTSSIPDDDRPKELVLRPGVVLPAPAQIEGAEGLTDAWLRRHAATIEPTAALLDLPRRQGEQPRVTFTAKYDDGAAEAGVIFADGVGVVGDRWIFVAPRRLPPAGEPFAKNTDQVPDASRITPMPVKPDERAGHDISVKVTIDTGGPGIAEIASASHDIVRKDARSTRADERPHKSAVSLKTGKDIPNRDFRLSWKLAGEKLEEAVLTHAGKYGEYDGGFFTLILEPPARIADDAVRPRELIFVLDQSGSMSGFPIECAKRVINQSIDTMRAQDRFNVISFSGGNESLWSSPQPNTADNRRKAQGYVDQRQGGGGTEMRGAILRALERAPRPERRADDPRQDDGEKPADPLRIVLFVTDGQVGNDQAIIDAIREHADRTRVFSVGMGHSPNRHLLDEMARVGRGAVDYVLPEEEVAPIVQRFADRIATPVLSDIELQFEGGVQVVDMLPSKEHMPDLFDVQPLVIHGRYTKPGQGTLVIRGRTGSGKYERAIDLKFPKVEPRHDTIATLWAREKVGELTREGQGAASVPEIIKLGESFQILTQHTSFVAVEKQRVTVGGKPTLVRVPIEFPKGMSWKGVFGEEPDDERLAERLGLDMDLNGIGDVDEFGIELGEDVTRFPRQVKANGDSRNAYEQAESVARGAVDVSPGDENDVLAEKELANLVDRFNTLSSEQRYAEANIVAEKARALAPNNPVAMNMFWKGRIQNRDYQAERLQERMEDSFWRQTHDTLAALAVPVDDAAPVNVAISAIPSRGLQWSAETKSRALAIFERPLRSDWPIPGADGGWQYQGQSRYSSYHVPGRKFLAVDGAVHIPNSGNVPFNGIIDGTPTWGLPDAYRAESYDRVPVSQGLSRFSQGRMNGDAGDVSESAQGAVGGQTLPSAYYLQDDVQYFPAGPEFKLTNQVRAYEEYRAEQALIEAERARGNAGEGERTNTPPTADGNQDSPAQSPVPPPLAFHIANLADGTPLVAVVLPKADRGDVRERLRKVLHGDVGQAFQPAESSSRADTDVRPTADTDVRPTNLGRVLPVKGSDDLWLLVPPVVAELAMPFAEKLAAADLADDARSKTLDELLATLDRELTALRGMLAAARRAAELRRRLDGALLERLAAIEQGEGRTELHSVRPGDDSRDGRLDPERQTRTEFNSVLRERVRVTVLLEDLAPATLATLQRAGFRREGTAKGGSFVVGTIGLDRLEDFALLPPVRRVEATE